MKEKPNIFIFKVCIIIVALILSTTFGCGGGNGGNDPDSGNGDLTNPSENDTENDTENEANRLVCERMFSDNFSTNHSLTIETYNMTENPLEGAESVGTICTIKKGGDWVSTLHAVNGNSATYDSLLAELQLDLDNEMIEDNSVGIRSAYGYRDDEQNLLAYFFLGSNNATAVTLTHVARISLEETRQIAQEIDSHLPDVDPLENTAPDYQCPDIIAESDLTSIFERELTYKSIEPAYRSNFLDCYYGTYGPDPADEIPQGSIQLYCDPPSNQITPQQKFQITEDMILEGHSDVINGTQLICENVRQLSGLGSEAYFYTSRTSNENGYEGEDIYNVIFLHNSRNCIVELMAYDHNQDIDRTQQIIQVAEKIDGNL